ncbi:protein kinase domain-containing protein [Kribbella sp. DT2]|uniref:serine/threonine-protein kinase n=1 Tax=Kribbella sp. DT2 TaxID=3393427 RepID=UPI003CEDAEDD
MQHEDPAVVGPFVVQSRLGSGAMGTVHLARSPGGRLVALKVVRPELADDPAFRARFEREVEAVRKVGGAFTAAVIDADPGAERPWLATEFLPGPTLQQAVDGQGPLRPDGLRYVAAGLAEALVAIHRAGVVHRDLKPSNILLTDNGPRVIDFGIARALEDVNLTATGIVVGTPGYLSPEQITGGAIGPASDLFSLGGVLVFAASGQGPFGRGPLSVLMHRVVHEEPLIPSLPDDVAGVVRGCLQRKPEQRPLPDDVLKALSPVHPVPLPTASTMQLPAMPTRVDEMPRSNAFADPPAPARLPIEGEKRPAPVGPTFTTSRTYAVLMSLWQLTFTLATSWFSSYSAELGLGGQALVCWLLSLVGLWFLAFRIPFLFGRKIRLVVNADGLTATRAGRTGFVPWAGVSRIRLVGHSRRVWLVVWLDPARAADLPASRRRFHGGHRVFPVAHGATSRRRLRQVGELRSALTWYAGRLFDENY